MIATKSLADALIRWQRCSAVTFDQTPSGAPENSADGVSPGTIVFADQYPTHHDDLRSNFSSQQYRDSVSEIVRLIRDGDSFQVNLAQRLLSKAHLTSPDLYLRLRATNPAPFALTTAAPTLMCSAVRRKVF